VALSNEPRLHVVSVPAAEIDWPRTERYSASVRAQRYADTRGAGRFRASEQRHCACAQRGGAVDGQERPR
jgi:hypothetical protein